METVEEKERLTDDAQQLPEEETGGFYRSQQEVDRAFKKRLEAEKKKWVREYLGPEEEEPQQSTTGEELPDAAAEEQDLEGMPLEAEEEAAFLQSVYEGERQVQKIDPEFEIAEEMRNNPMFALMIAQGMDVKRCYDFFHPQVSQGILKKAVEEEVIGRIRRRNARPRALGAANATSVHRDISRMSDEEILSIDARVKRGERVIL